MMPSRWAPGARNTLSMGKISIRQVDPAAEEARIRAVLGRNIPAAAPAERFRWLYRKNPDGPALVWLAEDADGEPVGTSAAHPRRMRVGGEVVRALNLSDFAFDTAFRTLGPALQLLKATLEPVRRGDFAFSYDYPSESMAAIYRRMGARPLGANERWARPVSLKVLAGRKLGGAGRAVGAVADVALRARDALARRTLEVEPLEGAFGDEFDALDRELGTLCDVVGVRDAAYLQWKVRGHAMWTHDVLCARAGGSLRGFAVLRAEGEAATLVDLFAAEPEARSALAAAAAEWAREKGAATLSTEVLEGGATAEMMSRLGFVRRDAGAGPVAFAPEGAAKADLVRDGRWWAMGGDRDI